MTTKQIAPPIIVVILVAIVWLGLREFHSWQQRGWERGLMGPYTGQPYTGEITTQAVSILRLAHQGALEVYELPTQTAPVLLHRDDDGLVRWAHLLQPTQQARDGQTETASVRELRLQSLKATDRGFQVLVTCDWDWGGRELGLVDLDAEYGFRSFRLDW